MKIAIFSAWIREPYMYVHFALQLSMWNYNLSLNSNLLYILFLSMEIVAATTAPYILKEKHIIYVVDGSKPKSIFRLEQNNLKTPSNTRWINNASLSCRVWQEWRKNRFHAIISVVPRVKYKTIHAQTPKSLQTS